MKIKKEAGILTSLVCNFINGTYNQLTKSKISFNEDMYVPAILALGEVLCLWFTKDQKHYTAIDRWRIVFSSIVLGFNNKMVQEALPSIVDTYYDEYMHCIISLEPKEDDLLDSLNVASALSICCSDNLNCDDSYAEDIVLGNILTILENIKRENLYHYSVLKN